MEIVPGTVRSCCIINLYAYTTPLSAQIAEWCAHMKIYAATVDSEHANDVPSSAGGGGGVRPAAARFGHCGLRPESIQVNPSRTRPGLS